MNTFNAFSTATLMFLVGSQAASAAVVFPQFELVQRPGDAGVVLSDTDNDGTADTFSIDGTAIVILLSAGSSLDISDEDFILTASIVPGGSANLRSVGPGTFNVGSLLQGSFSLGALQLLDFSSPSSATSFSGDVSYTGGLLQGSLTGGRIEGQYTATGDPSLLVAHSGALGTAKLGPLSPIPVPAAGWLLLSALTPVLVRSKRS